MKRLPLAAVLLSLAACTPLPESYPVPEQRRHADGPEPEPLGAMVTFSDERAPDYVLGGFLPAAPNEMWRWAADKPTVRVRTAVKDNLRLRVHFTLPDESHKPLLPITVRYFVNDRLLESVAYNRTGEMNYTKNVPPDWISTTADNQIRCEISPVYVAEADKAKLGMIISEIGLERVQ